MKSQFENVFELYSSCKTEWERNRPKWLDISRFVGITVDTDYVSNAGNGAKQGKDLDVFVDDPTAALCVNQAGDYVMGIMWGTGEKVFDLVPSRYVTELVDAEAVEDYYDFATDQSLYHMNHSDAGLSTAMKPYAYDQQGFGTSGIGTFLNRSFLSGVSDNALIFSNYGVDNLMIDEGRGGQCDIVFVTYNWKINRIVGEFCMCEGDVDKEKLAKLPTIMQDAYKNGNFNTNFKIVFGFFPREDYDPRLKGKRGAKYKGVWFMDDARDNKTFFEEDFIDRPIAVARAIKVRGEVYGRASGTLLNSTIKSVNFMVGTAIEIVEKMANPSLGIFSNSIFGDSVLDSSPNGLTVFNQTLAGNSQSPAFPLYDVGDPSAILQFIVPYLNEKITTGFKVDALLDFSSAKEMTATESLQRYAIRGKSLAGMLLQQKNECLIPTAKRSVSLLMSIGELGVDPSDVKRVKRLRQLGQDKRIIPDAVIEVIKMGRPWYEIRWNNELEKLVRTEAVQNLIQIINAITAIAALYPAIVEAVNWYKLLKDINENLDVNNQVLFTEDEFKKKIAEAAERQAQMMQIQAGESSSKSAANMAKANKDNSEAKNVANGR